MKTDVFLWFSCTLVAWLLVGCCKSETYYIDQEVKDFTVFQPGSWWVYVDSVSGRRDSVVVGTLHSGFQAFDTKKEGCEDKLEYFSYGVDVYTWEDNKEYIQINPVDEPYNLYAYDIHDLLRFIGGLISVKWNRTNYIYTPIGAFDRSIKTFEGYEYKDTVINQITYQYIGTHRTKSVLNQDFYALAFVERIGLVQHISKYHRIHLINHEIE